MPSSTPACALPLHAAFLPTFAPKMPRSSSATCLQTVLRLARQHRWVSDWLFTNPSSPFHSDLVLPPPSLNAALAWRIRKLFKPHLLDATEFQLDFDCILMPVAYVAGIVVGYTLATETGNPIDNLDFLPCENPFEVPYTGRFAYDTRLHELLHIVQRHSRAPVGVHFMGLRRNGGLEMCSFAVPCDEYCFERLPDETILMSYGVEYCVEGVDVGSESEEGSLVVADRFLPAVQGNERLDEVTRVEDGGVSYLPWIMGRDGLADGGAMAFSPMQMETSSGAFCYEKLLECLMVFGAISSGRYYMPTTRLDLLQEGVGVCTMYTGSGFDEIRSLGVRENERMKQVFAATYFASVLGVGVDQRLLGDSLSDETAVSGRDSGSAEETFYSASGEVEWTDWDVSQTFVDGQMHSVGRKLAKAECKSRAYEDGVRVRQRRAAPIAPAVKGNMVEAPNVPVKESKAERKERVADARRQRNRLSAARCNARKKEAVEAMQREIRDNKEMAKSLEGRREALIDENERLRLMVRLSGSGG